MKKKKRRWEKRTEGEGEKEIQKEERKRRKIRVPIFDGVGADTVVFDEALREFGGYAVVRGLTDEAPVVEERQPDRLHIRSDALR